MKKLIEKSVRKWIKKLDDERAKDFEKERLESRNYWNEEKEFIKENTPKLEKVLQDHIVWMKENKPLQFKVGDILIPDHYTIGEKHRYLSWCGGAHQITRNYENKVVTVKVTSSHYSCSKAHDSIEKYLKSQFESNKKFNVNDFIRKMKEVDFNIYPEVDFVILDNDRDFNPRWGLHQNEFLLLDSENGQITHRLWKRKIFLDCKQQLIHKKLVEWEVERNSISLIKITSYER